jgi:hypothetical protein
MALPTKVAMDADTVNIHGMAPWDMVDLTAVCGNGLKPLRKEEKEEDEE